MFTVYNATPHASVHTYIYISLLVYIRGPYIYIYIHIAALHASVACRTALNPSLGPSPYLGQAPRRTALNPSLGPSPYLGQVPRRTALNLGPNPNPSPSPGPSPSPYSDQVLGRASLLTHDLPRSCTKRVMRQACICI